jgi:hypothetical protein
MKEGKSGGDIMYSCMKMEKWDQLKLFQDWGEGDKGEWWRRWILIYCEHFRKCNLRNFCTSSTKLQINKLKEKKRKRNLFSVVLILTQVTVFMKSIVVCNNVINLHIASPLTDSEQLSSCKLHSW